MPASRETILTALHTLVHAPTAAALGGEVAPVRVHDVVPELIASNWVDGKVG